MTDYARYPRPESIEFFEKIMQNHDKVFQCTKIDEFYYRVERRGMSTIQVLITNFYTLGYGELIDILEEYPGVDCVLTISDWNNYTSQAYQEGKRRRVGVFKLSEFMGALNCERPHTYVRPIDRKNNH